jgi:hypothetical protein
MGGGFTVGGVPPSTLSPAGLHVFEGQRYRENKVLVPIGSSPRRLKAPTLSPAGLHVFEGQRIRELRSPLPIGRSPRRLKAKTLAPARLYVFEGQRIREDEVLVQDRELPRSHGNPFPFMDSSPEDSALERKPGGRITT